MGKVYLSYVKSPFAWMLNFILTGKPVCRSVPSIILLQEKPLIFASQSFLRDDRMTNISLQRIRRKFNSGLNRLSARRQIQRSLGLPREVQLVPTNACNLRCRACPKTYYQTDNRHLHPDVYEKVKRELFPFIRILNMQGLGEPMLSPLFDQMVNDAGKLGIKIQFVTNATKFNSDIMHKLVKYGADVTISLDGAQKDTHEYARPGSSFSTIMEVFQEFLELRKNITQTDFRLCINTVVTRRNMEELEPILDIAARFQVTFLNLISPGVGERDDEFAREAIGHYPNLLSAELKRLIPKAREACVGLSYPNLGGQPESGEQKPPMEPIPQEKSKPGRLFPGTCLDPWRLTYIDVDGWVRPCCRAIWIGMGNIMERPFRKIWNDTHYRKLRAVVNSNNPPDFCRSCTLVWGITYGDEFYMKTLEKRGIKLPPPPRIGVIDPRLREAAT